MSSSVDRGGRRMIKKVIGLAEVCNYSRERYTWRAMKNCRQVARLHKIRNGGAWKWPVFICILYNFVLKCPACN